MLRPGGGGGGWFWAWVTGLNCATFTNFRYFQLPFLTPQYSWVTLRWVMLRYTLWYTTRKKRYLNNYEWHLNNYCRNSKNDGVPRYILRCVIFATGTVKFTIYTVKCTGAHRNFLSATSNYSNVTSNYSNAVFWVYAILRYTLRHALWYATHYAIYNITIYPVNVSWAMRCFAI